MYLLPFRNQYRDQDFSLISDTIKEYFPVNKPKRLTHKTVASSPGFKKMGKIVNEQFFPKKSYDDKWGKLTSHLKKVFKKPAHGHPDLAHGGFFGEVIIEEDKKTDFIRQKSLRFYVSIIGPFFSIHGVDSSTALLEVESEVKTLTKGILQQYMQLRYLLFSNTRMHSISSRKSLDHFFRGIYSCLTPSGCLP